MSEREQFEAWAIEGKFACRNERGFWMYPAFSQGQMYLAWKASRRATLEESAKVCDRMVSASAVSYETGSACAQEIRALAASDSDKET